MSVLIAYGTKDYATLISDSRTTVYKGREQKFSHHIEDTKKIYRMTNEFAIGVVGDGTLSSVCMETITPNIPDGLFAYLQSFSYEQLLEFFIKRFQIKCKNNNKFCAMTTVGLDSSGRIRMDLFNTNNYNPNSIFPDDTLMSHIYLSPKINPDFPKTFANILESSDNKEQCCQDVIEAISKIDSSVNNIIQKCTISKHEM